MREYVPIFYDWCEVTEELTAAEKGRLIDAIVLYAHGGNWQERINGNERFLFPAFRKMIDRANEISEARAIAGSKPKQTGTKPNKPKQTVTNRAKANEEEKEEEEYIEDDDKRAREGFSYQHTQIGTLISTCLKAMTPRAWDELRDFLQELPEELVAWAVNTACEHGGNNWAYVSKVLRGLSEAGIRTVAEAEERSRRHRESRNARGSGSRPAAVTQNGYQQREYTDRRPDETPEWLADMLNEEKESEGNQT